MCNYSIEESDLHFNWQIYGEAFIYADMLPSDPQRLVPNIFLRESVFSIAILGCVGKVAMGEEKRVTGSNLLRVRLISVSLHLAEVEVCSGCDRFEYLLIALRIFFDLVKRFREVLDLVLHGAECQGGEGVLADVLTLVNRHDVVGRVFLDGDPEAEEQDCCQDGDR